MAKFLTASGTTYDYTITQTAAGAARNPDAFNKVTPREGGFVARNYINWDGTGLAENRTAVAAVANKFKVLWIPPRSIIRNVIVGKKIGETTIAHSWASGSGASAGSGAVLGVGVDMYKSASLSSTVEDVDALADHALTKGAAKGSLAAGAFGTVSASTPWTAVASQSDTSAPTLPFICPYGGWITMGIVNSTGSSASSITATMAGDMHIEAVCDYMPV
jgi:hypothetical protein